MTLASHVDEELTSMARTVDPAAVVVVENGNWFLKDPLGSVRLGSDRLSAARDLAGYMALLAEALPAEDRETFARGVVEPSTGGARKAR